MSSHHNHATRITRAALTLGYSVDRRVATTGTEYLTCERDDDRIVIRVGNHSEVYPPARGERRITFGFDAATVAGVIAMLREPAQIEPYLPAALTRDERRELQEIAIRERTESRRLKARQLFHREVVIPALRGRHIFIPGARSWRALRAVCATYGIIVDVD